LKTGLTTGEGRGVAGTALVHGGADACGTAPDGSPRRMWQWCHPTPAVAARHGCPCLRVSAPPSQQAAFLFPWTRAGHYSRTIILPEADISLHPRGQILHSGTARTAYAKSSKSSRSDRVVADHLLQLRLKALRHVDASTTRDLTKGRHRRLESGKLGSQVRARCVTVKLQVRVSEGQPVGEVPAAKLLATGANKAKAVRIIAAADDAGFVCSGWRRNYWERSPRASLLLRVEWRAAESLRALYRQITKCVRY